MMCVMTTAAAGRIFSARHSHSMWAWSAMTLSAHNGVLSVWDLLKSYTLATMTNCSCDIPLPQLGCVVTDTWSPFSTVWSAACGMVMFVTCFSHCDCHLLADDCDTGLPRKPEGVRAGERTMTFKGVNTCRKWRCKHRTIMFLPTSLCCDVICQSCCRKCSGRRQMAAASPTGGRVKVYRATNTIKCSRFWPRFDLSNSRQNGDRESTLWTL